MGRSIKNKPGCFIALSNAVEACECGHRFIENVIRVQYSKMKFMKMEQCGMYINDCILFNVMLVEDG